MDGFHSWNNAVGIVLRIRTELLRCSLPPLRHVGGNDLVAASLSWPGCVVPILLKRLGKPWLLRSRANGSNTRGPQLEHLSFPTLKKRLHHVLSAHRPGKPDVSSADWIGRATIWSVLLL
jgi:hypothetical protein